VRSYRLEARESVAYNFGLMRKTRHHKSASEAREGLRCLRLREQKLKTLRRKIASGVESLERGEGIEYASVDDLFNDGWSATRKRSSRPKRLV
jgi:hypothetical protein